MDGVGWGVVVAILGIVIVLGSGYAGLWLWYQYVRNNRRVKR